MKTSLTLLLLITTLSVFAQQREYWVFFTDKGIETHKLKQNPTQFLSEAAIQRRQQHNIGIDNTDLPVYPAFIEQVKQQGFAVIRQSKWLNAIVISTQKPLAEVKQQLDMEFIKLIRPVKTYVSKIKAAAHQSNKEPVDSATYGISRWQADFINLGCLHNKGFRGEGITIGVFDVEFWTADTAKAFDSLWMNNKVLAWYDFVDNDTNIFEYEGANSLHGAYVWSVMGANSPATQGWKTMTGTAPDANYILARTAQGGSTADARTTEYNWITAMEWADSMGVDVINTSLGYANYFTPPDTNYTYADMDGDATIITQGADMAAAKGILVVASAGNEGNKNWQKITAPCDGDSVLCVGAAKYDSTRADFSSFGPSFDGRIKPDVATLGEAVVVWQISSTNSLDGTSFSAPAVAGLAASLKQANPAATNMQIMEAIKQSAHQYDKPDTLLGYGIPNACTADSILRILSNVKETNNYLSGINNYLYPNPAGNLVIIKGIKAAEQAAIYSITGQKLLQQKPENSRVNIAALAPGIYIYEIKDKKGQVYRGKFVKQ